MKTMCLPYWLSPQWLCSDSCTWAHDLHKIMCPSCLCVYYVHLAYVRFEHSVCHGSDIYIYIYIYIYVYYQNNGHSNKLSLHWCCNNSSTWSHDVMVI